MNDNTRVLACKIDEDLRMKMKEYLLKEGKTVKDYVTGLIREDLERNAVKKEQEEKNKESTAEETSLKKEQEKGESSQTDKEVLVKSLAKQNNKSGENEKDKTVKLVAEGKEKSNIKDNQKN